ncbi:MAG: LysR family transcriptional regulator [Synergistaceae bacterium]|nr:LysR family transcriptional regulator [Synergistaceae bacterium]
MNISHYRYISVLAKTKNFTKASKECGITQPALTKAIRRIEEELGVTLFDRGDASPVRLTYAGERFLDGIQKIIDIQDSITHEMADISAGRKGHLSIGAPVETASYFLPLIIPKFMEAHRDIELEIIEGNSDDLERGMLDGTIDISIYTLPSYSPNLNYEVVEEHPVYLVTSTGHPFAKGVDLSGNSLGRPHYVDPKRLEGEKFLTLVPNAGMYRVVMQILERHGVNVDIAMQLSSHYTISALAASGVGICFTTYTAGVRMKKMLEAQPVFHTVDDPVFMRKTIIASRKGANLSPAALAMINLTRETLARLLPKKIKIIYDDRR